MGREQLGAQSVWCVQAIQAVAARAREAAMEETDAAAGAVDTGAAAEHNEECLSTYTDEQRAILEALQEYEQHTPNSQPRKGSWRQKMKNKLRSLSPARLRRSKDEAKQQERF